MKLSRDEVLKIFAEADCLATADAVDAAIEQLSIEITARLFDKDPLVYTVMNGGLIFAGRLLSRLHFPLELSYLHATRYGHAMNGTFLDWRVRPTQDLRGRTVLVIDDILDEGHTLAAIVEHLQEEGAEEVLTAVLVHKDHERKAISGMRADFTGLVVADRFLFGCGMDYKSYLRNVPGIYALKTEDDQGS